MQLAWVEGKRIRDIAPGDPTLLYHRDIARYYCTEVPDQARPGAEWDGKQWVNPQEGEPWAT